MTSEGDQSERWNTNYKEAQIERNHDEMKQNEPQNLEALIERNHEEDENKQCERHEHKRANEKRISKGDEKEREKA
eukprot:8984711-Ditylum_brightwellii.AAC.1